MWFLNYLWETDINPSKGKGAMISQKNSSYIDIKFALEKLVCQPPKYICMYVYKIQRYFDFKKRKEKICRARKNYKDKYGILFFKKSNKQIDQSWCC